MEKKFNLNMAKSRLSVGYTNNNKNFVNYWDENNVFQKANTSLKSKTNKDKYVLLDGPPYANGELHVGHALNKNFKDLVVKSRWFRGQPVDFRPGWDCHGLPLELAVEKKHGRQEVSKMKELCRDLALTSVESHKKGFKSLGVLAQWDNPYLTLSKENLVGNWNTLADLVKKNLLVYKQYPVHYCPACASSLAAAELEPLSLEKDSLYFKMFLKNELGMNLSALVWTTTPWTLPMNQALAFREDFKYELWHSKHLNEFLLLQNSDSVKNYLDNNQYLLKKENVSLNDFKVLSAQSPLTKKDVPLLNAEFVEEGKTGFVHMALAHGPEDFELGVKNGLLPFSYLNKYGKFETKDNENLHLLHGLNQEGARPVVLELLSKYNLLVSHSSQMQDQNVCWRHKKGVYYNATWQVFLNLEASHFNLKNKVKVLLEESELTQTDKDNLKKMLLDREHWCLSRQRTWGCEMNLLVDKKTNELSSLSVQYLNYLANDNHVQAEQLLKDNNNLFVVNDVLDVWFDSGNVVNTYLEHNPAQSENFVVNMALEGKDQYRGWFQAMMWLCVARNEKLPYQNLFCHGFVLDKFKNKLSKSQTNSEKKGLDYYVEKYGADTLHLWVANQEAGKDAVFSEDKLKEMGVLYSRLRLTLRFLSSNLYDYDVKNHEKNWENFKESDFFDFERFVLREMGELSNLFDTNFEHYNFKNPLNALYDFCNKTLSNFYFEYTKNPLYLKKKNSEERQKVQCAMYELFLGVLDFTKVFVPFVAEEFYQDYFGNKNSVFEQFYFTEDKKQSLLSLQSSLDWLGVVSFRKDVLSKLDLLQKEKLVKSRTEVMVLVAGDKRLVELMSKVEKNYRLRDLVGVSSVSYTLGENKVNFVNLSVDEDYAKCPKCWSYDKKSNFSNDWNVCSECKKDELE